MNETLARQQSELRQLLTHCTGTFFALGHQLRHARDKATGQQAEKVQWIIDQLGELRHHCGDEVLCCSPE
jgi:hypothetical protein